MGAGGGQGVELGHLQPQALPASPKYTALFMQTKKCLHTRRKEIRKHAQLMETG